MSFELTIEGSHPSDNADVNVEEKKIFVSTSDNLQDAKMTIIERITEEHPINKSSVDHHDSNCVFCITNEGTLIKPGIKIDEQFDFDGFIEYLSGEFLNYNTALPYSITIEKIYEDNKKEELHYKIYGLNKKEINNLVEGYKTVIVS